MSLGRISDEELGDIQIKDVGDDLQTNPNKLTSLSKSEFFDFLINDLQLNSNYTTAQIAKLAFLFLGKKDMKYMKYVYFFLEYLRKNPNFNYGPVNFFDLAISVERINLDVNEVDKYEKSLSGHIFIYASTI